MKHWFEVNRFHILIALFLYLLFQGFYLIGSKDYKFYSWIFLYMSVLFLSYILPRWKLLLPILIIVELPMILIKLIHPFIQSLLVIKILFLFTFGILAIILKYFPEYPFELDITFSSKLYILLIIGSMALTLWGNKAIIYLNTIINNTRTELRVEKQLEFTLSIVRSNKIKFVIYLGFLIYLIAYSIAHLSNTSLFKLPNVDKSIFNAFITYTAFERVLSNLNLIKINWKSFLNKLFEAWK